MKLDLFNIENFIKENKCPQITNPVFFNSDGTPTEDGLFSYELFGFSDDDRKSIFGYIDLKNNYIHPLIYLLLMKRMGALGKVINGEKYAVIADKKIKIVPETFNGAETGIDFIYDHFEEINWYDELQDEEIDSIDKKTRLKFLKYIKKEEFFIRYWLVLPPFYRDTSSTDKSMGDSINKLYKELLSKVKGMSLGFSFDIFGSTSRLRVQNILKDLYLSCTTPISGKNLVFEKGKTEGELKGTSKNSMLRRHLLGKTVDWATSSVITAPQNSKATHFKDKPVHFGYGSFPLSALLSMFQPFILNYACSFLEDRIMQFREMHGARIKRIDVGQFNSEAVSKLINNYIKNPDGRFEPIQFVFTDVENVKSKTFIHIFEKPTDNTDNSKAIERPLTLTDLMYIAAKNTLMDKHVYTTRFPIANYQNIYPSKVKVMTTAKVRENYLSFVIPDEYTKFTKFEDYPCVPDAGYKENDCLFVDVSVIGNAYLASLNGDYDGDTVFMRAVFSEEANQEAEKLIWSKTNFFDAVGNLSRSVSGIGKECILGLYELTKEI